MTLCGGNIALLEGQLSQLPVQGGRGDDILDQLPGGHELLFGLVVGPQEGQGVTQSLCDLDPRCKVASVRTLGHPVVRHRNVECVLGPGELRSGEGVWKRLGVSTGRIEVIGHCEDRTTIDVVSGADQVVSCSPVQGCSAVDVEAIQECLADLVVEEAAAAGPLIDPQQAPVPCLLDDQRRRIGTGHQCHSDVEVELLAEHRTGREQLQSLR